MEKQILWILIGVVIISTLFFGMPKYNVWRREQSGRAQLAEAEWAKQIQLEEARANLESQKLNAQAEVERAKGVAESNEIISGSIDSNYLRYRWIEGLHDEQTEVIYVPTEGNLPLFKNI